MSDDAPAGPGVGEIRPRRLHGEGSGRQRDVARATRSAADPRTEIARFFTTGIDPTAGRELIRYRLGPFMTVDDRYAVEFLAVRKTGTAIRADVRHVRHVRERDERSGSTAASVQRGIACVVMPRAEAVALVIVGIRARRRDDVVLHVAVRSLSGIAEVLRRRFSFYSELMPGRLRRRSG